MVSGIMIENHKHNIHIIIENYRKRLERDTEAFWVNHNNVHDEIEWCKDNLDDDCWFFEEGVTADCYFIKGNESIMAFKLRWS